MKKSVELCAESLTNQRTRRLKADWLENAGRRLVELGSEGIEEDEIFGFCRNLMTNVSVSEEKVE